MTQLAGWRFLELGRRIERAIETCRFVRQFADAPAPDGRLDVLLELVDSQITYRQRYVMIAARAPVIDLVMLDPSNPRSVAYQLDRIEAHLAALAEPSRRRPALAGAADRGLRRDRAAHRRRRQFDEALIIDIENALMRLSEAIARVLSHAQRAIRVRMGGARVIYDIRQTTTYAYASPVAHAHHVLRLTPINRSGPAGACVRASISCPNRCSAAKGRTSSATVSPGSCSKSRTTS